MGEEDYKSISILSSGEHVLLRIHDLWKKVHLAVSMNNYYEWDVLLDRVWCELVNLMEDDEHIKYTEEMQEIKKELIGIGSIVNNFEEENGFNKTTPKDMEKISKQYKVIMSKEEKIRGIQRKVEKKVIKTNKKNWD